MGEQTPQQKEQINRGQGVVPKRRSSRWARLLTRNRLTPLVFGLLLLAACQASSTPTTRSTGSTEEVAIEQFMANEPDMVPAKPTATPVPLVQAGDKIGISLPEIDPSRLRGELYSSGSPSLGLLTQQVFDQFVAAGYPGNLHLENQGTHIGYEDFCGVNAYRPLADFAGGTRPIQQAEWEKCLLIGRTPIGFLVSLNASVIVVHPANDFVKDVTIAQLAEIFAAKRWSDVNPAWPQNKLTQIIINPTQSTFGFFADVVFAGNQQRLQSTLSLYLAEDEIEIVELMLNNPDAISFMTYANYLRNRDKLRLVQIEGMIPTQATVSNGDWPFVTPVIFYSTADLLQSKPQLNGFLNFYLTHLNQEIEELGQFAVPQATLDRAKLNLLAGSGNLAWLDDLNEAKARAQPTPAAMLPTPTITATHNLTGTAPLSALVQPTISATTTVTR